MNHFDAVDFSECHSEEVISFFWRSVYVIAALSIIVCGMQWARKLTSVCDFGKALFDILSDISPLWHEYKLLYF